MQSVEPTPQIKSNVQFNVFTCACTFQDGRECRSSLRLSKGSGTQKEVKNHGPMRPHPNAFLS